MKRSLCLVLALTTHAAMAGTACTLTTLSIAGHVATANGVSFDFGDADDLQYPSAWQGPIKIQNASGQSCAVDEDVAIIERPLLLGRGVLYVPTYSGSENRLYAIDTKTCKALWKSAAFNGRTSFNAGKLIYGSNAAAIGNDCHIDTR
jgi:outer membrane protein assembly factor BamB